jgi:hypothetical protein
LLIVILATAGIAFRELKRKIGLKPTSILQSSTKTLSEITRLGSIHAELRAARLKEIAQIVLNVFAGDLNQILGLSVLKAVKALECPLNNDCAYYLNRTAS